MHPAQKERMARIGQVKEMLQESLERYPDHRFTRSVEREVINKAMMRFGCSERRAKEYVHIARIELDT